MGCHLGAPSFIRPNNELLRPGKREIVGVDLLSLTVLGDEGRRSISAKSRSARSSRIDANPLSGDPRAFRRKTLFREGMA